MDVIRFEKTTCKRTRAHLDLYLNEAFLNDELPFETNDQVLAHLDACPDCAAELAARRRVQGALQRAVKAIVAPPALEERIRLTVRQPAARQTTSATRQRPSFRWGGRAGQNRTQNWALAAAATLLLAIGSWGVWQVTRSNTTTAPALAETAQDVEVLTVGLGNHLHCAVARDLAHQQFTDLEMNERLGAEFAGLVPLVRERLSSGFAVVVGHRCRLQKREFVHLILKREEEIASLTITRKQGETFFPKSTEASMEASAPDSRSGGEKLAAAKAQVESLLAATGIDLRGAQLQDAAINGFETADYLVFITSNRQAADNTLMAARLAPAVRDFLAQRPA